MQALKLLFYPLSLLAQLPLRLLLVWLRRRCDNMWVVDLRDDSGSATEFFDQIERALCFIRQRDPRRAQWIESHLDYIINSGIIDSSGEYLSGYRGCAINYAAYRAHVAGSGEITARAQEVLTIELAQLIVHEATHARIDQHGVKYDEFHRERIEKRCRREEYLFLKRSAGDFADLFGHRVNWEALHSFDQARTWYENRWRMTRFDRIRSLMRNAAHELSETSPNEELSATWKDEHRHNWESAAAFQPWTEAMVQARGVYLYHAHDFGAAAINLSAVVDRQPENHDLRRWLAAALYFNRKYQVAIDQWLKLYEIGETDVATWISSGLAALNRYSEALEWHDRAAEDDLDEFAFLCARALLLFRLHRYDEALRDFDRAWDDRDIELGSDGFAHRASRAALLHEMGQQLQFNEACDELHWIRDWWRQSSDEEPRAVDAWVLRAHDEMWRPGIASSRAILLVCLDELESLEWRQFVEHISQTVLASRDSDDNGCDASYLRSLSSWNDCYPQRDVPEWLTGGKRVFAVDTMLDRVFLPDGYLPSRRVTCWIKATGNRFEAVPAGTFDPSRHASAFETVASTPRTAPA